MSECEVGDEITDLLQAVAESEPPVEDISRVFLYKSRITDANAARMVSFVEMFPGLEELHFSDNEISTDTAAQILQQVSASRRSRTPLWLRLDRCHQVDAKELIDVYGHIVCTRMCAPYGECQPFHCAHGRKVHCPHLGICGGDPNCPIGYH